MNFWHTGVIQWPSQVGWLSLAIQNRNYFGFHMQTLFENKIQRHSHITFGYFLVQYNFEPQMGLKGGLCPLKQTVFSALSELNM